MVACGPAAMLPPACAFDPADRYPSGAALREAIDAAGFVTGERRLPTPSLFARIKGMF